MSEVVYPWEFLDENPANPATFELVTTDRGGAVAIHSNDDATEPVAAILRKKTSFIIGDEPWYLAGRLIVPDRDGVPDHFSFGAFMVSGSVSSMATSAYVECGYVSGAFGGSDLFWAAVFSDGAGTQALISTVALDTDYHDHELWTDGANIFYSVDGETPITAVGSKLVANRMVLSLFHVRDAGGIGSPGRNALDKILCLTGLPTTAGPPT